MAVRCPKCGKNNYGDMDKCSFCGNPLKFTADVDIPEVKEEDIQEKLSHIKAKRLRNPITIGVGGGIIFVGLAIAVILYLIFMFWVFAPGNVSPTYTDSFRYTVPGGEEYIFGEITKKVPVSMEDLDGHGYYNDTAYEINGDGKDTRLSAIQKRSAAIEPDTWIYADKDLGKEGDHILVKVESKPNEFGESRAVYAGGPWWGGKGYVGGWIFVFPGLIITLVGLGILIKGIVGKRDTSIDRLMEEDAELRRQQLALLQSARMSALKKQKESQWKQQAETVIQQDVSGEVRKEENAYDQRQMVQGNLQETAPSYPEGQYPATPSQQQQTPAGTDRAAEDQQIPELQKESYGSENTRMPEAPREASGIQPSGPPPMPDIRSPSKDITPSERENP